MTPLRSTASDAALVRAARKGDVDAFDCLYRRYAKLVAAYLRRRTSDHEEVADLVAETFTALLSLIASKRELPQDPAAWLFGVAHNKLIDAARRDLRRQRGRSAGPAAALVVDEDAKRAIDSLMDQSAVEPLLAQLPEDQRVAVRARVLEEQSYADIARLSGTAEHVVRKRVSRGLTALRGRMESNYDRHL